MVSLRRYIRINNNEISSFQIILYLIQKFHYKYAHDSIRLDYSDIFELIMTQYPFLRFLFSHGKDYSTSMRMTQVRLSYIVEYRRIFNVEKIYITSMYSHYKISFVQN